MESISKNQNSCLLRFLHLKRNEDMDHPIPALLGLTPGSDKTYHSSPQTVLWDFICEFGFTLSAKCQRVSSGNPDRFKLLSSTRAPPLSLHVERDRGLTDDLWSSVKFQRLSVGLRECSVCPVVLDSQAQEIQRTEDETEQTVTILGLWTTRQTTDAIQSVSTLPRALGTP